MIDLHSHTTESDGTYTPAELVAAATEIGLDALAITDHDTLAGYRIAAAGRGGWSPADLRYRAEHETAVPAAEDGSSAGLFSGNEPTAEFVDWLLAMQAARRDRNRRLAAKLQSMGIDIRIEEVEAIGRSLAGRPHFARLMVQKGLRPNTTEPSIDTWTSPRPAMSTAKNRRSRREFERIREAGGVSSLAHPIRLGKRDHAEEEDLIAHIGGLGLDAIEAYHSDHGAADVAAISRICARSMR